jgi:hypothetical protein
LIRAAAFASEGESLDPELKTKAELLTPHLQDILWIIRAAATTIITSRVPCRLTPCSPAAFGFAFGSSARVYRPRSPSITAASSV